MSDSILVLIVSSVLVVVWRIVRSRARRRREMRDREELRRLYSTWDSWQ